MRFAFLLKPVGISSDVGRDLIFTGVILHFWVIGISALRTTVIGVQATRNTHRIHGQIFILTPGLSRVFLQHPDHRFLFAESGSVF